MCILHENFGVVEVTLCHSRWTWGEIWKVISCASHVRTLVWWRGHFATQDGCKVRFEKSSHVHLTWELWCSGGDTWPRKMDMRWDLKSHLTCILHEKYLNRCYLFDVPRPNDEYLQDFPLYTFQMSSHMDARGHLVHARWMWGEIWKVISHDNFVIDVTSSMSQGQMKKICKIFPLYTFQMSSRMDVRWDLKSHLVCTLHENFAIRCYLFDVPRPNDEYLQDFSLYTFQMSSCVDTRDTWSC